MLKKWRVVIVVLFTQVSTRPGDAFILLEVPGTCIAPCPGHGPEELVSQEDLSGARSCTAEQRGVGAGRGAVLRDGWEAVAPGFSCASRTPAELCHWVKRATEDIGKKQHQSVRRASRRNDFSAAKHSVTLPINIGSAQPKILRHWEHTARRFPPH